MLDRVRWEVTKPTRNTFFLDDTSIRLGTQAPTTESLEVARLTADTAWGLNGLDPVSVSDRNAIWRAWLILQRGRRTRLNGVSNSKRVQEGGCDKYWKMNTLGAHERSRKKIDP